MKAQKQYKVCRRLGAGIYEKCQTDTYTLRETRRKEAAGMRKRRRPLSDYGKQLLEKQKVRLTYGITEKQFRRYVDAAAKATDTSAAEKLVALLEARLDNTVYRLGLASTRRAARQMVSHGHITVNGKKIKVPSHAVRKDDVIGVREGSKSSTLFENLVEKMDKRSIPAWLTFDVKKLEGKVNGVATAEGSGLLYDFASVIQFYSR